MARNEFTKKSIGTLTLGEKLQKIRGEKRISIADVSKNTQIQAKYLEYLENGNYDDLPADVYVKGFLKSYANYLGVEERPLLKLYEREKNIIKNLNHKEIKEDAMTPLKFSSWMITPKLIFICLIILLISAGFFYLYNEANIFISTPRLIILEPKDGAETDDASIKLSGLTEKDAGLWINGQATIVGSDGKFEENLNLHEGTNTVNVKASNRFGKETSKTISIKSNYKVAENPDENQNSQDTNNISEENKIKMEIYVNPNPIWLSVEADGNLVYSGILSPNSTQTFEAKKDFKVSSGKGNNTFVKINGKDKEVLNDSDGVVKDIIFNAE
jgi:transcriptional regulator with XRE-family HTH domain